MNLRNINLDSSKNAITPNEVYGVDYIIEEKDFFIKAFLDWHNKRIIVLEYEGPNISKVSKKIDYLATANEFDKVFIKAKKEDWEKFISYGYHLEGIFKYFYNGKNAYSMSKFFSKQRRWSEHIEEENKIIDKIMKQDLSKVTDKSATLDKNFIIRTATSSDIDELATFYQEVFKTYPTPLNKPKYIAKLIEQQKALFKVFFYKDKLISAASADMELKYKNAEVTDCATNSAYRGKGLMSILIKELEKEIKNKHGVNYAYTLARAKSFGINNVFYRLGYEYNGRLINNCDIMGDYEDMNLWTKKL